MAWDMDEAVSYYKRNGAPGEQNALIGLLGEVQEAFGGIPSHLLPEIAEKLGTKQGVLLALIRRIPRLDSRMCIPWRSVPALTAPNGRIWLTLRRSFARERMSG